MLGCFPLQGCTSPGRQVAVVTTFCSVRLIFVGSQYGTCFMGPSGAQNFEVAGRILYNFHTPVPVLL